MAQEDAVGQFGVDKQTRKCYDLALSQLVTISTTESVGCSSKFRGGNVPLGTIKAAVQKVVREGEHGPYVVATSDQLEGSVTFSLEPTVWKEKEWPEEGVIVVLGKLRQKYAGWRAKTGRFFKSFDEQIERRKTC